MRVDVRAMSIDDCDSVLTLWRRCDDVRLCDDDSRAHLTRQLARNPGLSQVAVVGASLVGAILCLQDGRRGVIRHLAIDPSHRRRGLGRRLVQCCLDGLRARGLSGCNVFVLRENPEVGFWHRMHFVEREELRMLSVSLGQGGDKDGEMDELRDPAGRGVEREKAY